MAHSPAIFLFSWEVMSGGGKSPSPVSLIISNYQEPRCLQETKKGMRNDAHISALIGKGYISTVAITQRYVRNEIYKCSSSLVSVWITAIVAQQARQTICFLWASSSLVALNNLCARVGPILISFGRRLSVLFSVRGRGRYDCFNFFRRLSPGAFATFSFYGTCDR
jgi:hypothetical protein